MKTRQKTLLLLGCSSLAFLFSNSCSPTQTAKDPADDTTGLIGSWKAGYWNNGGRVTETLDISKNCTSPCKEYSCKWLKEDGSNRLTYTFTTKLDSTGQLFGTRGTGLLPPHVSLWVCNKNKDSLRVVVMPMDGSGETSIQFFTH